MSPSPSTLLPRGVLALLAVMVTIGANIHNAAAQNATVTESGFGLHYTPPFRGGKVVVGTLYNPTVRVAVAAACAWKGEKVDLTALGTINELVLETPVHISSTRSSNHTASTMAIAVHDAGISSYADYGPCSTARIGWFWFPLYTEAFFASSLNGGAGDDILSGFGDETDPDITLSGSRGSDTLISHNYEPFLIGGTGDDLLFGMAGDEESYNGDGGDDCIADLYSRFSRMRGGAGSDASNVPVNDPRLEDVELFSSNGCVTIE